MWGRYRIADVTTLCLKWSWEARPPLTWHFSWVHKFVYLSTTNNTKSAYIKRVILQENEDKIRIQGHFKFIRSLLSCYSYRSLFEEALSPLPTSIVAPSSSPHLTSPHLYWQVRYATNNRINNNTLGAWMDVFIMSRFDPFLNLILVLPASSLLTFTSPAPLFIFSDLTTHIEGAEDDDEARCGTARGSVLLRLWLFNSERCLSTALPFFLSSPSSILITTLLCRTFTQSTSTATYVFFCFLVSAPLSCGYATQTYNISSFAIHTNEQKHT